VECIANTAAADSLCLVNIMRCVLCAPLFSVVSREKDFTCCGDSLFWIHDTHHTLSLAFLSTSASEWQIVSGTPRSRFFFFVIFVRGHSAHLFAKISTGKLLALERRSRCEERCLGTIKNCQSLRYSTYHHLSFASFFFPYPPF
jgi:hypothetical protein